MKNKKWIIIIASIILLIILSQLCRLLECKIFGGSWNATNKIIKVCKLPNVYLPSKINMLKNWCRMSGGFWINAPVACGMTPDGSFSYCDGGTSCVFIF